MKDFGQTVTRDIDPKYLFFCLFIVSMCVCVGGVLIASEQDFLKLLTSTATDSPLISFISQLRQKDREDGVLSSLQTATFLPDSSWCHHKQAELGNSILETVLFFSIHFNIFNNFIC